MISMEAAAQSPLPRIGLLLQDPNRSGKSIVQSLAERGYIHGKTARIEERYAEGRLERLPELARELVALRVDVIVAFAASATVAARQATSTIPIVMAHAGDPIGYGLIESLAHPGGNITGTTSYSPEIAAKGIEILHELVPAGGRLAMLVVPSNAGTPLSVREVKDAAATIGMDLTVVGVEKTEDLAAAFGSIENARADMLYVFVEPLLWANRLRIMEFAAHKSLPTLYQNGDIVRDGGLIGYSPLFSAHYPRVAEYVDKILKGAKPSELPVEQSTRFELVINIKTAKAAGITIPTTLLVRADEVIE
jgi:putative ABC transport system substrate-binding protein